MIRFDHIGICVAALFAGWVLLVHVPARQAAARDQAYMNCSTCKLIPRNSRRDCSVLKIYLGMDAAMQEEMKWRMTPDHKAAENLIAIGRIQCGFTKP